MYVHTVLSMKITLWCHVNLCAGIENQNAGYREQNAGYREQNAGYREADLLFPHACASSDCLVEHGLIAPCTSSCPITVHDPCNDDDFSYHLVPFA